MPSGAQQGAATTADVLAERTEASTGDDTLHCVSRDPNEPAGPEFLDVCDDNPVDVFTSVRCPAECGGHPICAPCLEVTRRIGLVR